MNTKNLAQLTVIILATVLSQRTGQAQTPQVKQNYTLNNLPEQSCPSGSNIQRISFIQLPSGKGLPSRTVGAGSR